ncbi:DUF4097 family beta strand repeat-containing protein [Marinitenerispora sediminis]|nr:DUF4097 family beta strand repeat-containing protein [Marinitenerispora sediminis]
MPARAPRVRPAAGALLTVAVLASCAPGGGSEREERGFGPVGDRLTIAVDRGDLDVRPSDVAEVEVTRWLGGWPSFGAETEAAWELVGDRLEMGTGCGPLSLGRCDVRYEVLVPRDVALTVEGGGAQVTAAGFDAALEIDSENGAVRVEDVSGPLTLRSDNGELRGSGVRSARVAVESRSGEIHLSFAAAPARVVAAAENGAVTIELPDTAYDVTTATDNGAVRSDVAQDPGSPHAVTVRTDNGAIDVRTAAGA